jgi:Sel1 repeat-containing protein
MNVVLRIAIVALITANPTIAIEQDSISECKDAAAHWEEGRYYNHFSEIDAEYSIGICLNAVTEHEHSSESYAHLCRAYYKAELHLLAIESCETAIDLGSLQANISLASLYAHSDPDNELYRLISFDMLNLAAMSGSPWALYNLADFYETGYGTESDPEKALELFKIAANKGFLESAVRVSALLSTRGEREQAEYWYHISLEQYADHFGAYSQSYLHALVDYFYWTEKHSGLSVLRQLETWIERESKLPYSFERSLALSFMQLQIAQTIDSEDRDKYVEAWENVLYWEQDIHESFIVVQEARDRLIDIHLLDEDYVTGLEYVHDSIIQAVRVDADPSLIRSYCGRQFEFMRIPNFQLHSACLSEE